MKMSHIHERIKDREFNKSKKYIFLIMSLMFVIYKGKSKISKNVKINKI